MKCVGTRDLELSLERTLAHSHAHEKNPQAEAMRGLWRTRAEEKRRGVLQSFPHHEEGEKTRGNAAKLFRKCNPMPRSALRTLRCGVVCDENGI